MFYFKTKLGKLSQLRFESVATANDAILEERQCVTYLYLVGSMFVSDVISSNATLSYLRVVNF